MSNLSLVWLDSVAGMSVSMFGLGLGWCFAYVAGSTELVDLAGPVERGRLVGTTDLTASLGAAVFAIGGGVLYSSTDTVVPLALVATALALLGAVFVASARGRDLLRAPEPAVEAP